MKKTRSWLKQINIKSLIKVIALVLLIVVVILMSFLGVGLSTEYLIDVNQYGVETWVVASLKSLNEQGIIPMAERLYVVGHWKQMLTDSIITSALGIIGMILFESIVIDYSITKDFGSYQKELKLYNEAFSNTNRLHIYLSQFIYWRCERDLITKKVSFLLAKGINQAKDIVKYITIDNFESLSTSGVKIEEDAKTLYIRKITNQEQLAAIQEVLSGKLIVISPGSEYYLTSTGDELHITPSEVPDNLKSRIKQNRTLYRVTKIIGSLVLGFIFSIFTIMPLTSGDNQAMYNLFVRLFAIIFGAFSGGLTATIVVNLLARMIEDKKNTLNELSVAIESKEFIPENNNDLARKEYDEYYKKLLSIEQLAPLEVEHVNDIFAKAEKEVTKTDNS